MPEGSGRSCHRVHSTVGRPGFRSVPRKDSSREAELTGEQTLMVGCSRNPSLPPKGLALGLPEQSLPLAWETTHGTLPGSPRRVGLRGALRRTNKVRQPG